MTHKPRRFDLSPDNFIAGIGGKMNAEELGVYWLMCLLFYSHAGPFEYDEGRFCSLLAGTHWRTFRAAFRRLEAMGKVSQDAPKNGSGLRHVTVKTCSEPLDDAFRRVSRAVENGSKGGRPPIENNDLGKPDGFQSEKLARAPLPPSPPQPLPISSLRSDKRGAKNKTPIPEICPDQFDCEKACAYWRGHGADALCGEIDDQVLAFRAHHLKLDSRMADWSQAWVTWYGNAIKFSKVNGNGHGRKSAHAKAIEGAALWLRELEEKEHHGASDAAVLALPAK